MSLIRQIEDIKFKIVLDHPVKINHTAVAVRI